MTEREAKQYSPLALAFLGDAVYERLVRERLLLEANMPVGKLHELTIKKVCAEYQAKAVDRISYMLTESEADIVKRGRNASGMTVPKHASVAEYRKATGLESLFGYLELIEAKERIEDIFEACMKSDDEVYDK